MKYSNQIKLFIVKHHKLFIIVGVIPLLIPPDVDEINTTVVGAEDFNHPVTPSDAMRGTDPSSIGFSFTLCDDEAVTRYGRTIVLIDILDLSIFKSYFNSKYRYNKTYLERTPMHFLNKEIKVCWKRISRRLFYK